MQLLHVVISLSKIKISKAIHNWLAVMAVSGIVVISLSKIKISKAIHNYSLTFVGGPGVVISLSKIKISKAIRSEFLGNRARWSLAICQEIS